MIPKKTKKKNPSDRGPSLCPRRGTHPRRRFLIALAGALALLAWSQGAAPLLSLILSRALKAETAVGAVRWRWPLEFRIERLELRGRGWHLRAPVLNAQVSLRGLLRVGPALASEITLVAPRLDLKTPTAQGSPGPGAQRPFRWPAHLPALRVEGGELRCNDPPVTLHDIRLVLPARSPRGSGLGPVIVTALGLRAQAARLTGRLGWSPQGFRLRELTVGSDATRLAADLDRGKEGWSLRADIGDERGRGGLHLTARSWRGELEGLPLSFVGALLPWPVDGRLSGRVDLESDQDALRGQARLQALGLRVGEFELDFAGGELAAGPQGLEIRAVQAQGLGLTLRGGGRATSDGRLNGQLGARVGDRARLARWMGPAAATSEWELAVELGGERWAPRLGLRLADRDISVRADFLGGIEASSWNLEATCHGESLEAAGAEQGREPLRGRVDRLALRGPAGELTLSGPVAWRGLDGLYALDPLVLSGSGGRLELSGLGDQDLVEGRLKLEGLKLDGLAAPLGLERSSATMSAELQFRGPPLRPQEDWRGAGEIAVRAVKPHPAVPSLQDGHLWFACQPGVLAISSAHANWGTGRLRLAGRVAWPPEGQAELRLDLSARDVTAIDTQELFLRTDAELTLSGAPATARLAGRLDLRELRWYRDFGSPSAPEAPARGTRLGDGWELDVALHASREIWLDNREALIEGRADLRLQGTLGAPRLTGEIEVLEGGYEFLQNVFRIEQGRIHFGGTRPNDPYLDLQGETDVGEYRITAGLRGRISRVRTTLSSDPQVGRADIISLLTVGRLRQELNRGSGAQAAGVKVAGWLKGRLLDRYRGRARRYDFWRRLRLETGELPAAGGLPAFRVVMPLHRRWQVEAERDVRGADHLDLVHRLRFE